MHLFYKVLFDPTDPSIENIVLIAMWYFLQQHSNHAMLGVHASAQSIINYGKVARKHHLIGPSLDSLSRYVAGLGLADLNHIDLNRDLNQSIFFFFQINISDLNQNFCFFCQIMNNSRLFWVRYHLVVAFLEIPYWTTIGHLYLIWIASFEST